MLFNKYKVISKLNVKVFIKLGRCVLTVFGSYQKYSQISKLIAVDRARKTLLYTNN